MKNLPIQSGERIILRPFLMDDANTYASWLSDPELRHLVGEPELSVDDAIKKQTGWTENSDIIEYMIVDKVSQMPIGDISLKQTGPDAKFGIMIAEPHYRQLGYGREAANLLFEYAKRSGIKVIYSEVFEFNEGSIRFHGKLGFTCNGRICDENGKDCISLRKLL